ncbi:MAG: hypothetical protein LBK13_03485 [Spirochaetales bacterium]|jgi:predicted transposase YdaD|nr:hypothetical protein [Spirochaetales bacterium]
MDDTTLTLEKVLKEAGLTAKWEARGEKRGKAQAREELTKEQAIRAFAQGFSEETIASIVGLDVKTVREIAAESKKNKSRPASRAAGK